MHLKNLRNILKWPLLRLLVNVVLKYWWLVSPPPQRLPEDLPQRLQRLVAGLAGEGQLQDKDELQQEIDETLSLKPKSIAIYNT